MRRLTLLFALLSITAFAETHVMWQRNHGAWEAVVRVSKDEPFWDFGDFRGVTNGLVTKHFPHREETNVLWRVDYDYYSKHQGNNVGVERFVYSYFCFGYEYIHPPRDPLAWTNDLSTLIWQTNHLVEACVRDNGNQRYDFKTFTPTTNVVDVTRPPVVVSGGLPCRFGVPAAVTVDLPYTDLLEMLPLNWPDTFIRVRTGFDGYILLRFDENEMRLTIKRLLPEKLPYERNPRNRRVSRDDLLNGV